jgi:hypothetical protein
VSDKPKKSVLQRFVGFITDAAKWIADRLAEEDTRLAVYADLGLKPPADGPTFPDMTEHFDSIDAYRKKDNPDADALKAAVEDIKAIRQAIRNFVHATQGGSIPDEVFDSLILLMSTNYLRLRLPAIYWWAQPFGLMADALAIGALPKKETVEVTKAIANGFVEFIKDPIEYTKKHWPTLETEEDARVLSHAIFTPLSMAFVIFQKRIVGTRDVDVLYGWEPEPGSTTPTGDRLSNRTLSFAYTPSKTQGFPAVEGMLLASLALVPRQQGGPGVFVSLGGSVQLESIADGWSLKSKLGSASAFSMLVKDWSSATGPSDASVEFNISRIPDPTGLPTVLDLGSRARMEFGNFAFAAGLGPGGPTLRLTTGQSAFVLESKSDAVLDRGMPQESETFRLEFNLTLGLANGKFYFEGGSNLQVVIPVTKKLGPVQARGITLRLVPSTEPDKPAFALEITATIIVILGPFTLTIDRIGLNASVTRQMEPDASFHPPNGLGVAIQSEVVSGGGFISFDPVAHQYAGVLELSIKEKVTLKAVAVLNTRIDNKPAFSFLIFITATGFPPISLGLGFQLTGVGGLLGLDREMKLDALEAGLTSHVLDRILFPPDPVANASEIVTACSQVFPPKRGQTIFGPMLQISWGASQLVRIELAVIIQIPSSRLAILGKLRAYFPTKDKPVLKIEIDLIGTFDFERKRAFAHATLTASKLAGFTLSGAAAMLLYWGDDSTYLISFGGFNPHYVKQVPAEFPKLPRLALALAQRENLTIKVELYCAVTSNSFQIGGSLTVVAKKGKFSVEGFISIDALFQSGEPSYIFGLVAKLQLKAYGVNLFMVKIEGSLSGSHPWHVVGKVTFSIWIFDYSIPIDHTWGDADATPELPAVNVAALVHAELSDVRNWTAEAPAAAQSLVTLKQPAAAQMLLHPLGSLQIAQRVAPLNVNISRFGETRPQGQTIFAIETVSIAGSNTAVDNVQEPFARAQFIEMTQDEKLATPAFDRMNSGVRVGAAELRGAPAAEATIDYQTLVWDAAAGEARPEATYSLNESLLAALATVGPAAKAAAARTGGAKYRGPARQVQVSSLTYVVASTETLAPTAAAAAPGSYTGARSALKNYLVANPQQRGKVQVLPLAR